MGCIHELFDHMTKASFVVTCIANNEGVGVQCFPTPPQTCFFHNLFKSLSYGLFVDVPGRWQALEQAQYRSEIFSLISAFECAGHIRITNDTPFVYGIMVVCVCFRSEYVIYVLGEVARSVQRGCLTLKHLFYLSFCLSDYDRYAWFDDAGLLSGDGFQCVPQLSHVIETDVGDGAGCGSYDVGRVQSTTQTYFNDSHINGFPGKPLKSHHGGHFKE